MTDTTPAPPAAPVADAPVPLVPAPTTVPPPPRWLAGLLAGLAMLAVGVAAGALGVKWLAPGADQEAKAEDKPEEKKPDDGTLTFDADKQRASGIEVTTVAASPMVTRAWRTGRVALHEDRVAHVAPLAEGVIRDVPAKLGQAVAAGETLAVLDSREFGQAKLEAYKTRLALVAEREVAERTRVTMANAEELLALLAAETPLADIERKIADKPIGDWRQQLLGAYTRRNQLRAQVASLRSSPGGTSETTLRKTEAESEAAGATYTALVEELRFQSKHQVRQADLKLNEAKTSADIARAKLLLFGLTGEAVDKLDPIAEGVNVSLLAVKAPLAGVVVEKHAVRSERADPHAALFVVADLSRVWVQADVFETDLPLVRDLAGKRVPFRAPAAGLSERSAEVQYPGDLIDKATRSLTLTAEADNPDRALKPGLFVEVGFDTGTPAAVLQVPATAVLRQENRPFVFVRLGADQFRRRDIELGRADGDRVEVTAGLKAGDQVVVRGGYVLKSELFKDQLAGE